MAARSGFEPTVDVLLRGGAKVNARNQFGDSAVMVAALGFGIFDFSLSNERAGLLKRAALVNIIWLAVMVAVSLRYFFIIPVSFLAVTLLIFVFAWLKLPAEAKT